MNRIEKLIYGLEDCGFTHEEAVTLAKVIQHPAVIEIVMKKMEKEQKAQMEG
ncbi:MAG: hypothetical protein QIT46_gp06 [Methanophagales virus PBV305]|uniref:Uncharacterized protein n=1 Tax=Methanophagales virus PBV305 TaxID=3071310 RepID=A0AA46TE25_9VIRU|nr:MAG: hypothetical protein QIT46_gp06 [Methanophagales virus PBV305]UYL65058.1 MAG: hypothetical protein HJKPNNFO_00006 [Methanophagales virus PBV305]